MSIEKKSLISNRSAAKKALVTKPEVNKVASTKTAATRVANFKLGSNATRLNLARIKMS